MPEKDNRGRTIERAFDIVEFVGSVREPVRLSDIARETGLHLATTQRMTATLVQRGYLRAASAGYTIGPVVLGLARAFTLQDRLTLVSFPVLQALTADTELTSSVFVPTGTFRVLICRVDAPAPLRYQFPAGHRLGLVTGAGKALLAFLPEQTRDAVLADHTGLTLADGREQTRETLAAELAQIRRTGFHLSVSEREIGTLSISAPIWNAEGDLIGEVVIVAHDDALTVDELLALRPRVLAATRAIGEQM